MIASADWVTEWFVPFAVAFIGAALGALAIMWTARRVVLIGLRSNGSSSRSAVFAMWTI